MANSLIRGLLANGVAPGNILATDIDAGKLSTLREECGIVSGDAQEVAGQADVLVLAVKPQVMKTVCRQIHHAIAQQAPLVVSIAAGITIDNLRRWLGGDVPIVRCMPNTPALVGEGATGLYASGTTTDQKALAEAILSAVGLAVWVGEEAHIDAVTALSGSGPAYFFLLMEAMQDVALEMGLDADTAHRLTCQTAVGAARLAQGTSASTGELRRQVTSPGGTTEQAILRFETGGLRKLVREALLAARSRSQELARDFGDN